ncbi:hypothetical protein [Plantactinospora sp. GCM10030261]|uniref:hypothetical protein n=1 Tax=Plantactinospora sp. GCM10030261 TaxID=3273420 RepID=UPI00361C2CFD
MTHLPRAAGTVGPGDGSFASRVWVVADTVGWLQHVLDDPAALVKVRRVTVQVRDWQNPARGWSGRIGPLRHLLAHQVRLPDEDEGPVTVEVTVRWSRPLREIIAAVLPVLQPYRPLPTPASADVTAFDVWPNWLGAGLNTSARSGSLPENKDVRPYDVVLTAPGEPPPAVGEEPVDTPGPASYGAVVPADAAGVAPVEAAGVTGQAAGVAPVETAGRASVGEPGFVLIDVDQATLVGRYGPFGPRPAGELSFPAEDGLGWQVSGPDGVLCAGRLDHVVLPAEAVGKLAEISHVTCRSLPARNPTSEAALLVRLMAAGIAVHVPDLPEVCAAVLAEEVREAVVAPPPTASSDVFDWEVWTVRQKRAALRQHARGLALPRLTAGAFPGLVHPPSVSVVLVTKRLEHVMDAVAMVEAQTYPALEIVLGLHGVELPPELRERLLRSRLPMEIFEVPAGYGFGEAIGAATARARGSLVTKVDDDDTYGPEHVWDLVLARHYSGAMLVGKGAEFVYLESLDLTVRRDAGMPECYGWVTAGGTMLIGRGDLEAVGGWRPVPRSIDRGLIDRVHRAGGLVYRTHALGYVYHRRSDGHTWDPGLEYFLRGGGMQWSGLIRHSEFGTVPAAAGSVEPGGPSADRLDVDGQVVGRSATTRA